MEFATENLTLHFVKPCQGLQFKYEVYFGQSGLNLYFCIVYKKGTVVSTYG